MLRQCAKASLLLAFVLGAASPAFSRSRHADKCPHTWFGVGVYSRIISCSPVDISASGVFSSAYIYQEGIVSIDALLPTGFNIADPSTYGGVIFFTPGYDPIGGATYFVSAYFASSAGSGEPPRWGFNFFTSETERDDVLFPDMQVLVRCWKRHSRS